MCGMEYYLALGNRLFLLVLCDSIPPSNGELDLVSYFNKIYYQHIIYRYFFLYLYMLKSITITFPDYNAYSSCVSFTGNSLLNLFDFLQIFKIGDKKIMVKIKIVEPT
jgi:hypothetical protein